MKIVFRLLFVLFLSGLTNYCYSQKIGVESISIKELKGHLKFLASDDLEGRRIGTEVHGLDMAADYIASNSEKIGLKPGYKNYFQPLTLISARPDKENTKLILKNQNKTVLETDSLIAFSKEKEILEFDGEIVFAGFGYIDSTSGYNDFKDLDLRGKIVMYVIGSPSSFKEEMDGNNVAFNNRLERTKWDRVVQMGAKGIILINSPMNKGNSNFSRISSWMNRASYSLVNENDSGAEDHIVFVPSTVYDLMIGEKRALKSELKNRIQNQGQSDKQVQDFSANVVVSSMNKKYNGKNVVGLIEGSDPLLKNECVVFMAHYDHLGVDSNGDVYNGADDNGSGSVTLLELAEAFNTLGKKPKRSIVFLWVTCEELGMFGSHYYTDNPLFPMKKTVACINLDMVGRVYEKRDEVWEKSPKKVKDFKGLYCLMGNENENLVKINDSAFDKVDLTPDKSLPSQFLRSSDHYYFYSKGVPIINYATGYHADYHKVSDEVSKINFKKMKKVAELCFYVGYGIANQ